MIRRFRYWLHLRWLRRNKVILPPPSPSCRRNTTEAVP